MKAYETSDLNSKLYSEWRVKFEDFFESERYFFEQQDILNDINSIMDIGCASGGAGKALMDRFGKQLSYTGVDPDPQAIKIGKKLFENNDSINLIEGYFPEALNAEDKYDLIIMFALFPQLPEWKKVLIDMAKFSNRYMLISLLAKTEGVAIIDKDVSYAYYLDSGERVYQVIHNIYHVVNFCFTDMINARKVSFYGYHTDVKGNSFRELPNNKIIRGNILIELEQNSHKRIGAIQQKDYGNYQGNVFKPEVEIMIDGDLIDY